MLLVVVYIIFIPVLYLVVLPLITINYFKELIYTQIVEMTVAI